MFSEILRIKPVLDEATAKQMEQSLSSRFVRVASRFGSGLKSAIKGTVLGISLGLLNKLLNPLEALETKITNLLGHGAEVGNLSERLGASPGEVDQLRNVALSFGVTHDQFNEIITKFADSIEKAREEIANPFKDRSESTLALGQFAKQENIVTSFKDFMAFLQKTAQGNGTDQPLTTRASRIFNDAAKVNQPISAADRQKLLASGEIRARTGVETVHALETDVFGAQQFGPMRRLIESNVDEQAKKLKQPSIPELTQANEKLAGLESQKKFMEVQNQTKDFMEASKNINESIVKSLESRRAMDESEVTDRLKSYSDIEKTAETLSILQEMIGDLSGTIVTGLRQLTDLVTDFKEIRKSSIWRTFFRGER